MKRIIFLVFSAFLLCSSVIFSAMGAELQGGYYITGDSALGSGLTFYVPADHADGSLTYDDSGILFNLTSSSIYLYCPDYPGYTIYASRFSGFQYRPDSGSGYQYQDLNLRNVSDTNVQIFVEDPAPVLSAGLLHVVGIVVLVIGICLYCILPKR